MIMEYVYEDAEDWTLPYSQDVFKERRNEVISLLAKFALLVPDLPEIAHEYINEAEHQDGFAYWCNFVSDEAPYELEWAALIDDFTLYVNAEREERK